MDKKPIISVIMPVYKVEQYLETAADSILKQSYKNIELILVDDCSPDKSGEICDQIAQSNQRVKVIHKVKNQGLGQARNTGMQAASGDWLMFIDSDDWIDLEALEYAVDRINDNVDIVVWGYCQDFEDNDGIPVDTVTALPIEANYFGLEQIGRAILDLDEKNCFNYAWNKLYRTSFLEETGFFFDSTPLMEDFVFNIKVFPCAKGVATIEKGFSHYRKTPRETLVSKYHSGFFELCKMKMNSEMDMLEKSGNNTPEYIEKMIAIHLKHIMNACMKECSKSSGKNLREQYQSVCKIIKDEHTQKNLKCVAIKNKKLGLIQNIILCNNGAINFIMFKLLNFIMVHMAGVWRKAKRTA